MIYNITWETMIQNRSSWNRSLLNSSVKTSITFTIFGCNELKLLLLQKLVHFLNVLHVADIIACASDGTDVVDETASTLIRPTSEVLDRVDVLLWFQEVWSMDWEWYRWWDCNFHDPWNHDCVVQSGTVTIAFLHSSWIFYSIPQMMLKGGMA